MMKKKVTVSAPGKILLVGGYLVLEAQNVGLVVAADKRFYTTIESDYDNTIVSNSSSGGGDGGIVPTTTGEEPVVVVDDGCDDDVVVDRTVTDPTNDTTTTNTVTTIRVDSPQFHTSWEYRYDHRNETLAASLSNSSINPFVEKTLYVCLLYLMNRLRRSDSTTGTDDEIPASSSSLSCDDDDVIVSLPPHMTITIQADNDFYSVLPHLPTKKKTMGGSTTPTDTTARMVGNDNNNNNDDDDTDDDYTKDRSPSTVAALPRFLQCPIDGTTGKVIINKTGLGSSAALTTSLVGGLVRCIGTKTTSSRRTSEKTIIHNLAQICHCHAQGKVGSGFDVSAACYGTHVYRRFPSSLLADLLEQLDTTVTMNDGTMKESLTRLVELDPWRVDMVQSISLPPSAGGAGAAAGGSNLQIMLADVRGGSESPGMARKVLNWKAEARAAAAATSSSSTSETNAIEIPYWTSLGRLNARVVELMQQLMESSSSLSTEDGGIDYDYLSTLPASDWPDNDGHNGPLKELHNTLQDIRTNLRSLGEVANVPIEPPPQTSLCDATMALPGVVAALVPGAGGYDAIVCLYINRPTVVDAIGTLWSTWKDPIICPLSVKASDDGFRVEVEE